MAHHGFMPMKPAMECWVLVETEEAKQNSKRGPYKQRIETAGRAL
jgi:hypothetical protein